MDDYLRPKPAEQDCPIPTLSLDAARAPQDGVLRRTFAERLQHLARAVAGDPPEPDRLVLLAAMVGASVLRRASDDAEWANRMEAAIAAFSDTIC